MAKGPSGIDVASTTRTEALVNTGELSWPDPDQAAWRVRQMQRKLHHWAVDDSDRCFDDVFNLVHHPDFLTVAWERVRGECGHLTWPHLGPLFFRRILGIVATPMC